MRFFRRNESNERLITCPSCCQLIPAEAQRCEMCGADLQDLPAEQRSGFAAGEVSRGGSPYAR